MCSFSAARLKLPSATTIEKYRNRCKFMFHTFKV